MEMQILLNQQNLSSLSSEKIARTFSQSLRLEHEKNDCAE